MTYVEPYFDEWEDEERSTVYDRFFNIRKYRAALLCVVVMVSTTFRSFCVQHPLHASRQGSRWRHRTVHEEDHLDLNGVLPLCQAKKQSHQTWYSKFNFLLTIKINGRLTCDNLCRLTFHLWRWPFLGCRKRSRAWSVRWVSILPMASYFRCNSREVLRRQSTKDLSTSHRASLIFHQSSIPTTTEGSRSASRNSLKGEWTTVLPSVLFYWIMCVVQKMIFLFLPVHVQMLGCTGVK